MFRPFHLNQNQDIPLFCPIVVICVPAPLVFLCPYSFAFSRRSYKWIWTIYNLLGLASLIQHVLEIHLGCCYFSCCTTFHAIDSPQFTHLLVEHLSCFQV